MKQQEDTMPIQNHYSPSKLWQSTAGLRTPVILALLVGLNLVGCTAPPVNLENVRLRGDNSYQQVSVYPPLVVPNGEPRPEMDPEDEALRISTVLPANLPPAERTKAFNMVAPAQLLHIFSGPPPVQRADQVEVSIKESEIPASQVWSLLQKAADTQGWAFDREKAQTKRQATIVATPLEMKELGEQSKRLKVRLSPPVKGSYLLNLTSDSLEPSQRLSPEELTHWSNLIMLHLVSQQEQQVSSIQRQHFQLEPTLSHDENYLPTVVLNAPYADAWPHVLALVSKLGFVIRSESKSSGLILITFPGSLLAPKRQPEHWKSYTLTDPVFDPSKQSKLSIQAGDLTTRTSLQFFGADGAPFSEEALKQFFPLIEKMCRELNQAALKNPA